MPVNRGGAAGFTLVELMVGMAVASVVLGALSVSSIALQRSFEAANYQMTAQNDQLRILDYLSRDLHIASKATRSNDGGKITLTLPADQSSLVTLQLGPLLGVLQGTLGGTTTGTKTVSYYVEGGEFIREQDGAQTILADTVDKVNFDSNGSSVTTSLVFTPRFSMSATTAAQALTRAESCVLLRNATVTN